MQLLYQTHSPYARKVLVMIHELGLAGEVEVIHHETSPTLRNDTVFAVNPLGKVPVLVMDDGAALFDSVVICDYLAANFNGRHLLAATGQERWRSLRLQAVAQGIADAGIAVRWDIERRPAALRWAKLAEGQREKLLASYDYAEADGLLDGPLELGQIALATALDWIAFRGLPAFRDGHPRLTRWYEAIMTRPALQATSYAGATIDQ